jgi:hypothetical protein
MKVASMWPRSKFRCATAPKRVVARKDKRPPATRKLDSPGYSCGRCAGKKKGHTCPFKPVRNEREGVSETRVRRPSAPTSLGAIYRCSVCGEFKLNHMCPGPEPEYSSWYCEAGGNLATCVSGLSQF